MFIACLLMFSRISIALLFIFSFISKILALTDFEVTISDFKLLPRRWSKVAVLLFLSGEIVTAALIIIGGGLLTAGFLLAIALLMVYSIALLIALQRNTKISCNCFGRTGQHISRFDVVRNVLLMLCSLIGLWMLRYASQNLTTSEVILLGTMSTIFVVVITNLGDVVETIRKPLTVSEEGNQK